MPFHGADHKREAQGKAWYKYESCPKIFGTHSERELKRIDGLVQAIEDLRPAMMDLSDEELRAKTEEFKKRLAEGETLDDLLVDAFAVVRKPQEGYSVPSITGYSLSAESSFIKGVLQR